MWNYLLESFRNKKNRPLSFFVNWIGMTLGLTAVIVIYLLVMQELRHDKDVYSQSMESVYRCSMGDETMGNITPSAMRKFVAGMPEVKSAARAWAYNLLIATEGTVDNKKMNLKLFVSDTNVFEVFPFKLSQGNEKQAFVNPMSAVVSRETAVKLFGTENVIGKTIKLDNVVPLQITAVMENVPENSVFAPNVIVSLNGLLKMWNQDIASLDNNWGNWNFETYVRLNDGVDPVAFEAKMSKTAVDAISKMWGSEYESIPSNTKFEDVYFEFNKGYSQAKAVDMEEIWVMGMIAVLILIIAIINYVNIYTARSTEVIRAMGVKSIMGARRIQLIAFVIFDSVVITFISALSAFLLAGLLEPLYIDILGSTILFSLSWDMILVLFVGVPLVCGVISGIFPAIVLTKMKPLDAIANRSSGSKAMAFVRNALIVFQFTISIALIGSTLFINKQMNYISEMDMGYNRENIVVVQGKQFMPPKFETFRDRLLKNPNITQASLIVNSPISVGEFMTLTWGPSKEESRTVNVMRIDEYSLSLMGVKMLEGDSIKNVLPVQGEERKYIINETFAKILRQQNPEITFPFKQFVGVFSDFQNKSVQEVTSPLVMSYHQNRGRGDGFIKVNGNELDKTLAYIEQSFQEIFPDELYEFDFLDKQFSGMYRTEQLFRSRLISFSILAVFIGCMGLFALVSYSVQRRRKEIAIRKVYGSTIGQVLVLLTLSFLKWLVVSFVIAAPIIYYVATTWVGKYVYRTELSWWIFALSLAVAMFVALITVIGQAYHAATENPAIAAKAQ